MVKVSSTWGVVQITHFDLFNRNLNQKQPNRREFSNRLKTINQQTFSHREKKLLREHIQAFNDDKATPWLSTFSLAGLANLSGIIENNNQRQIDSALDDCDLDSDHEIVFFDCHGAMMKLNRNDRQMRMWRSWKRGFCKFTDYAIRNIGDWIRNEEKIYSNVFSRTKCEFCKDSLLTQKCIRKCQKNAKAQRTLKGRISWRRRSRLRWFSIRERWSWSRRTNGRR